MVSKINMNLKTLKSRCDHSKTFSTPEKQIKIIQPFHPDLDEFKKSMLQRLMHHFHLTKNILPTAEILRTAMQEETGFRGSEASIKNLKETGLK